MQANPTPLPLDNHQPPQPIGSGGRCVRRIPEPGPDLASDPTSSTASARTGPDSRPRVSFPARANVPPGFTSKAGGARRLPPAWDVRATMGAVGQGGAGRARQLSSWHGQRAWPPQTSVHSRAYGPGWPQLTLRCSRQTSSSSQDNPASAVPLGSAIAHTALPPPPTPTSRTVGPR